MPFVIRMYKLKAGSVPSNDHLGQGIEDYILYTRTHIYTVNLGYNIFGIHLTMFIDHYDHNQSFEMSSNISEGPDSQVICFIFETM